MLHFGEGDISENVCFERLRNWSQFPEYIKKCVMVYSGTTLIPIQLNVKCPFNWQARPV